MQKGQRNCKDWKKQAHWNSTRRAVLAPHAVQPPRNVFVAVDQNAVAPQPALLKQVSHNEISTQAKDCCHHDEADNTNYVPVRRAGAWTGLGWNGTTPLQIKANIKTNAFFFFPRSNRICRHHGRCTPLKVRFPRPIWASEDYSRKGLGSVN